MLPRNVNRILWIGLLTLVVVMALRTNDEIGALFARVGTLDVVDVPERDTLYFTWRGKIEAPMAARISEAFDKHGAGRRTVVLSLASPGGSLDHGARVIRVLAAIKQTHKLETIVEGRARCASMCVPVYLQGDTRTASASSRFMFHEVSFSEYLAEEESVVPASAKTNATEELFARYFAPAGVPDSWSQHMRTEMAGGNDIWKSGQELVDENAGIVQRAF